MKFNIYLVALIAIISSTYIDGIDNPHFYRATNMFPEPRIEHDYLTSFFANLEGGTTTKGRSASNEIVPLFDIYGTHNIQKLNSNTLYTDPNNSYDLLLNNLAKLPTRPNFATISLAGSFNIVESNLSFTQNFAHGLFLFFYLPVRKLKINAISSTDLSPDDEIFPNKQTPEWQSVFQDLNPLLANYGINTCPTTSTGAGDLTSWLGWTHNYQDTTTIDFVDVTVMGGLLAPTGKKRDENKLFSLPTGYNGHWAFPLCTMLSVGCYEWVTIGGYLNTLFFLNRDQTMRLKTDSTQRGIIKLAHGNVSVHKGPLINTGIYFKADHFGHGFSLTTAYSFALQKKESLNAKDPALFNCPTINSDSRLAGWNMHTFNFSLEYDFGHEGKKVGNRIGLFYNLQIAGSQTFNTNITGGMYGLDIGWYI